MCHTNGKPRREAYGGASEGEQSTTTFYSEDNITPLNLQADRLIQQFGLRPLIARTVAEHAFAAGGAG